MPTDLTRAVTDLAAVVGHTDDEGLRGEVHADRADRKRQTRLIVRWGVAVIVAIVVGGTATIGGAYVLILQTSHRADRRWCGTLTVLTTNSPPPTTERGRQVAAELAKLRDEFGCR